jgi:hypothetical protein
MVKIIIIERIKFKKIKLELQFLKVCLCEIVPQEAQKMICVGLHGATVSNYEIDSYKILPVYGAGNVDDIQSVFLPRCSFLQSQATFVTLALLAEAECMSLGFLTGFDSATENLFHFAKSTLLSTP